MCVPAISLFTLLWTTKVMMMMIMMTVIMNKC